MPENRYCAQAWILLMSVPAAWTHWAISAGVLPLWVVSAAAEAPRAGRGALRGPAARGGPARSRAGDVAERGGDVRAVRLGVVDEASAAAALGVDHPLEEAVDRALRERHHGDVQVVDAGLLLDAGDDLVDCCGVDLREGEIQSVEGARAAHGDLHVMEVPPGVDEAGRLLAVAQLEAGAALGDLHLERLGVVSRLGLDGVVGLLEAGRGEEIVVAIGRRTAARAAGGERDRAQRSAKDQSPLCLHRFLPLGRVRRAYIWLAIG